MQIILQCHTDPELKSNEAESVDGLGAAVARFTQKVPTRHANGHYERPKPIKVGRSLHARPRSRLFLGKGEQPSLDLGLVSFGAPKTQLDIDDFSTPEIVFQIGLPPQRIDILTSISGVEFADAWNSRMVVEIDGMSVPVLGLNDLLINRSSSGREKDLSDIPAIKRLLESLG